MDPDPPGAETVSVADAARRLGVSPSTVHNWLHAKRLAGVQGPQPMRPRWRVWVDADGRPVDPVGRGVASDESSVGRADRALASLVARVDALEQRGRERPVHAAGEPFRDAALQLQAAMGHQKRALELQTQAFRELNDAVAAQAEVIAGLLVGEPLASLDTDDRLG